MSFLQYKNQCFRFLVILLVLLIFFALGMVWGYNPLYGFIVISGIGFVALYCLRPLWFAYLYVFIVSFASLFNLPVTEGGFSSAVAVALSAFPLCVFGALISKDRTLIRVFSERVDQLLPFLFLISMMISLRNSRAISISLVQVQQFFYQVVIYYFLCLMIRDRTIFSKAFFFLLLGGIFVGLLGMYESVIGHPIYYLFGREPKSLFGATLELKQAISTAQTYVERGVELEKGRIIGLIGDGPLHGIYMTMIAMVTIYFFLTSKRNIIRIACVVIFLISIYNVMGSGSRGAFVSLIIALFLFWIFADIPHKMTIVIYTIAGCVVLVIIMVIFMPTLYTTRSFTYSEESSDTAEMRVENIPVSIMMFIDRPIFGNGPDGFIINYARYAHGLSSLASREKNLRSHNTPLQVLAEYGLVGISLWAATIIMAILRMVSILRHADDQNDKLVAVILLSSVVAYAFFSATLNVLLDKYFWMAISFSQIHYSICTVAPPLSSQSL